MVHRWTFWKFCCRKIFFQLKGTFQLHTACLYIQALKQERTFKMNHSKKEKSALCAISWLQLLQDFLWAFQRDWGKWAKSGSPKMSERDLHGVNAQRLRAWPSSAHRRLRPRRSCSLHLHVAQQPLFDTSLQHPGTEASSCNPTPTEEEQD